MKLSAMFMFLYQTQTDYLDFFVTPHYPPYLYVLLLLNKRIKHTLHWFHCSFFI